MKGPGLRIDLDVRRIWRCAKCGKTARTPGHVTAQRCGCSSESPWMQLEMPVPRAPFQPPHREPLPEYGEEVEAPIVEDARRGQLEGGEGELAATAEANTASSEQSEPGAPGQIVSTAAVEDLPPPAEFPVAEPPAQEAQAVEVPVGTPGELQDSKAASESSSADDFGAGLPGVADAPDVSNI